MIDLPKGMVVIKKYWNNMLLIGPEPTVRARKGYPPNPAPPPPKRPQPVGVSR